MSASNTESEQYAERFVFHDAATAVGKSASRRMPTRLDVTLDVLIAGVATVNLYASNIEDNGPAGTRWGAPVRTFTASEKVVISGEPWIYYMAEISSWTSGAVTVVGAA